MPAIFAVVLNSVTVSMSLICAAGVIFMLRFLAALLVDEKKVRARYLLATRGEDIESTDGLEKAKRSGQGQADDFHYLPVRGFGQGHRL